MQTYNNREPIYLQIMQRLCRQIVRGERSPGDKLPSVRDLAIEMGVNPNTAQRVYMELERIEVVETRRGLGTYITEHKERLNKLRDDLMHDQINNFVLEMKEMGFSAEEVILGIQHAFKSNVEEVK